MFKKKLEGMITLDFGAAIKELKAGRKVVRSGWNGKGMFLYYVPEGTYPALTEAAKSIGEVVDYNPYLAIKNVNDTVSTWVPSINDCLAEDWKVLEHEQPGQSNPTGAYGDNLHGIANKSEKKVTPDAV